MRRVLEQDEYCPCLQVQNVEQIPESECNANFGCLFSAAHLFISIQNLKFLFRWPDSYGREIIGFIQFFKGIMPIDLYVRMG